ncbi:MAG: photosystem II reaction center protein PsbZ [Pseudanabaenaceae cyanobacterium bins.68]|nr:photosystem II reaction center protein PsbZ [Pseudanabaenaceae cyanobacterium bins.68]
MAVIFQLLLAFFVLFSFVMVVAVPVAYATPSNWNQSKPFLLVGSGLWLILVVVIGVLNSFVV